MFRLSLLLLNLGLLLACSPSDPKREVTHLCRISLFHQGLDEHYNLTFNLFKKPRIVRQRFLSECEASRSKDGQIGRISHARYYNTKYHGHFMIHFILGLSSCSNPPFLNGPYAYLRSRSRRAIKISQVRGYLVPNSFISQLSFIGRLYRDHV